VRRDGAGELSASDGRRVLEAVERLPGGRELLRLGREREDVALVGGATRDLLMGRAPRELDVVLGAGAADFARELGELIGEGAGGACRVTVHDRFGTAALDWDGHRVDVAERRAESYPSPGALPEVRRGSVEQDLLRRDFTVNAIAAPLGGELGGTLQAAPHALEDLAGGRLRVLHGQSFLEDPTRLLRLARYSARLGFATEDRTAQLAAEALAGGALASVSRARVGAELRLALAEPDPVHALTATAELGVLAALEPWLELDPELARRALALAPADGRPDLLLLAQLLLGLAPGLDERERKRDMFEFLDGLELTAGDRERVISAALAAPGLVTALQSGGLPSQMHDALARWPPEAVALAGALGGQRGDEQAAEAARRWLESLRHVRLSITGDDLLAAGVPPGPQVGRRLAAALHGKLDGQLAEGREAELQAALEARL
jgi:tRNA nucleotidyltransferase (CCA-adding enzyme)